MKTRQISRGQKSRSTEGIKLEIRAREAVTELMFKRLVVPNIYFDAPWPSSPGRVDMVAIDRAGSGDVHVFDFKGAPGAARAHVQGLLGMPGSYRWLVVVSRPYEQTAPVPKRVLDAPQGMGRIGLIEVELDQTDRFHAHVAVPAERFSGSYYELADQFKGRTKPDLVR